MNQNRTFVIIAAVLIIGLVSFWWFTKTNVEQTPITYEELYNATLQGQESERNYLYNDFVFIFTNGAWNTRFNKVGGDLYSLTMHYGPKEVEQIPASPGLRPLIASKQEFILVTDSDLTARTVTAMFEVGKITGERYGFLNKPTATGVTANASVENQIASCQNASASRGVIYFHLGEFTQITKDANGCVHVVGETEDDILRAANKLIYILLQIMPESFEPVTGIGAKAEFGDWNEQIGVDGLSFSIITVDDQQELLATEGYLEINATHDGQVLYQWETPLLITMYNQTGNANMQLDLPTSQLVTWDSLDHIDLDVHLNPLAGPNQFVQVPMNLSGLTRQP